MFPTITLFSCVVSPRSLHLQGVDGELDPEDDPNNQGEDEFEEAEEDQHHHRVPEEEEEVVEEEEEPAAPAQHRDTHPQQPAVEEELVVSDGPENGQTLGSCVQHQSSRLFFVFFTCLCFCVQMAGNPDQQEDTLDDQYQEEVEDEVWNTDALTQTLYIRNKSVKYCISHYYMRHIYLYLHYYFHTIPLSCFWCPEGAGGHSWWAEERGGGGGGRRGSI